MNITRAGVYTRLKKVLSDETGRKIADIRAEQVLTDDLGFTLNGKRALSVKINEQFSDVQARLTPDDCAKAETVKDLTDTVWEKIPDTNK